jgi:foldase protein PrsA
MATTKAKTITPSRKRISTPAKTEVSSTTSQTQSRMSVNLSKRYLFIAGVIILVVALIYAFRSLFIVATVNGQPITRLAVIQELEKQGGKQTMITLVIKTLIEQEAAKKRVNVSQKEIDDEIKKIEANLAKQGQTLDQVLQLQGMSRDTLVSQIRTQKMVEKLVGPITVTNKEVDAYVEANKSTIPENSNMSDVKKTVKVQLQQQKVNEKAQAMLQNLQKNAKINYIVNY